MLKYKFHRKEEEESGSLGQEKGYAVSIRQELKETVSGRRQ